MLEYEPARDSEGTTLRRTGDARKSSGTFYTPRAVTSFMVDRIDPKPGEVLLCIAQPLTDLVMEL